MTALDLDGLRERVAQLEAEAAEHRALDVLSKASDEAYAAQIEQADARISTLEREVMQAREEAARHAECAFDDRPNSRSGHHSEMDWTDGYRDGTRAAAAAIRALNNHSSEGAS